MTVNELIAALQQQVAAHKVGDCEVFFDRGAPIPLWPVGSVLTSFDAKTKRAEVWVRPG